MNVQQAYNNWADQYDTNENKTRDLEAIALQKTIGPLAIHYCLELGCGTGKNTQWLLTKAEKLTCVDLSEEMLAKAKQKIQTDKVNFLQFDLTKSWPPLQDMFDLVIFSLVLEHINDLDFIFSEVSKILKEGGYVYLGELHPFKQYSGSKARFETEEGIQIVDCYIHHISDFTNAASKHGLRLLHLQEYFDSDDRSGIPRILSMLFDK